MFITEQFPYPLNDGGNLRTYHILRGLTREHEVWLVAHGTQPSAGPGAEVVSDLCHVTTVREPPVSRQVLCNVVRRGIRRYPLFVLKNWSEPILRAVDLLLTTQRFDVIHFNAIDTACYALVRNWAQRTVFDTHNCLSLMARQVACKSVGRIRRAVFAREAQKLRDLEREVCRRMDATLVCSAEDATAFRSTCEAGNYVVVPNGVETAYYNDRDCVQEEPSNLAFVGAMGYYPNEEAAVFFCRQVMPLLSDIKPPVRLFLVGKDPSAKVQALNNATSVTVTGKVEDVRPFIARAQALVIPLQTGGGTRLKILEAFAMGKAVISTPLGAEGIPAEHGKELLLADDPECFAQCVRRVLKSQELRTRLGQAARKFVCERYDWSRVHQVLLDCYRTISARGATNASQVDR